MNKYPLSESWARYSHSVRLSEISANFTAHASLSSVLMSLSIIFFHDSGFSHISRSKVERSTSSTVRSLYPSSLSWSRVYHPSSTISWRYPAFTISSENPCFCKSSPTLTEWRYVGVSTHIRFPRIALFKSSTVSFGLGMKTISAINTVSYCS